MQFEPRSLGPDGSERFATGPNLTDGRTMSRRDHNIHLEELDRASIFHPVTSIPTHLEVGPFILSSGLGCRVTDSNGKSYLDAAAGLWCMNVGYGRESIARAAYEEMARMGYFHTFRHASNAPQILLGHRLLEIFREEAGLAHMSKIFFGCTGSDANDTQIKIVWFYNNILGRRQKKKIISRRNAYHGVTVASGSLTGIDYYRSWFDPMVDQVLHVSPPHHYRFADKGESEEAYAARLADELEEAILREGAETVAAFIAEPVMGTGGVIVPPATYFEKVQAVLRKYDILFIVDEVICGLGRLGCWFGSSLYGLDPDLVSMAKGLTSAYFPMSAVAVSDRVWDVLVDRSKEAGDFAHGFTYSGHPVGGAVGLANLDIIVEEDLIGNAARVGPYFKAALSARLADHPLVGEIRGEGLMLGVELVADRACKTPFDPTLKVHARVASEAAERGLLVRALPVGCVNSFSPPLTFTREDADEAAEIYSAALAAATQILPLPA